MISCWFDSFYCTSRTVDSPQIPVATGHTNQWWRSGIRTSHSYAVDVVDKQCSKIPFWIQRSRVLRNPYHRPQWEGYFFSTRAQPCLTRNSTMCDLTPPVIQIMHIAIVLSFHVSILFLSFCFLAIVFFLKKLKNNRVGALLMSFPFSFLHR